MTRRPAVSWSLVTDALAVLPAIDPETLEGKAAEAVALLALLSGQDVDPATPSTARTAGGGLPARSPRTG
jgi:hypothetical protein